MWLSIVIPTYNDDETLTRLLDQISNWDLEGVEVIVVDGKARLRPKLVPSFVRYVDCQPSRGKQLRLGARLASADKILFLHSDSWFEQSPIDILKMTTAQVGFFKLRFDDRSLFFRILEWGSNVRAHKGKLIFGDQGLLVEKSLYIKSKGFPDQPLMEDYELSNRLSKLTSNFVQFPLEIWTSTRKYKREGRVKTFFKMQTIKIMYKRFKIDTDTLRRLYYKGK